jgi:predicted NBD/HSP70 family sugar kinase
LAWGWQCPYFLGGWADELGFPPAVVQLLDFDLRRHLAALIGREIMFENDASVAATAELVYRWGRQFRTWIYLSINTFIGGGFILNGNLRRDPTGTRLPMALTRFKR